MAIKPRRSSQAALLVPEIVILPAEIDTTNAHRTGEGLHAALRPGVPVVIADMSGTTFCDSSGIRQLLLARDRAAETRAELRIVTSSEGVLRILQMSGMDQLLSIYPTLEAALTGAPAR